VDPGLLAFAEDPAAYLRVGPDEERVATDRAVLTFSPGAHFWSTQVARVRFGAGDIAAELDGIRSLMRSRERSSAVWSIGPSATPVDVVDQLTSLGVERESADGSSILVLTSEPAAGPSTFGTSIVTTFEDHLAAIEVANEGFGFPGEDADDERRRARATFEAERGGDHTARFLAFDDGRPVAVGRAWFAPQGVYLGGVATIPSHRRRGAMGGVIAAAWAEAVQRGTAALVAWGGDMSTSGLQRLGFEAAGKVDLLIDRLDG
jgi:hypothetical protein